RIGFRDDNLAGLERVTEVAVEWPQENVLAVIQRRSDHISPADDCSLADLIRTERPEEGARCSPARLLFLAFTPEVINLVQPERPQKMGLSLSTGAEWIER